MDDILIEGNCVEAKKLIKYSLEQSDNIRQYYDNNGRIIAKTGITKYGLSWGTVLIVEIHENGDVSKITVESKKEFGLNVFTDTDEIKQKFVSSLNSTIKKHKGSNTQIEDNYDTKKQINNKHLMYNGKLYLLLSIFIGIHIWVIQFLVFSGQIRITVLYLVLFLIIPIISPKLIQGLNFIDHHL